MIDGVVASEGLLNVKKNHSLTLMPMVDQVTRAVGVLPNEIDRIVVAQGPGSYTGLRIGVTTAKTLAYTLNKELVGISSLATLAGNAYESEQVIVPLFDARRQNVYAGAYRYQKGKLVLLKADTHIAISDLLNEMKQYENVLFLGDAKKFEEEILAEMPQAVVNQNPNWDIPHGGVLAMIGSVAEPTDNIHGFLPHYLKRVEAEERWLEKIGHPEGLANEDQNYVEKI
jgi:tRNA threonylcarbamoyl adenosine modification protein YeaZ